MSRKSQISHRTRPSPNMQPITIGDMEIFSKNMKFPFSPGRTDGPLRIDVFGYEYYADFRGVMVARIWPEGQVEIGPGPDKQRIDNLKKRKP